MLQYGDPQLHIDFINEFLIGYDADNDWPLPILWTDDAHFNLNGNMNNKNCVHLAGTNSHAVAPVALFDTKVTVRCIIFIEHSFSYCEVTEFFVNTSLRKRHQRAL